MISTLEVVKMNYILKSFNFFLTLDIIRGVDGKHVSGVFRICLVRSHRTRRIIGKITIFGCDSCHTRYNINLGLSGYDFGSSIDRPSGTITGSDDHGSIIDEFQGHGSEGTTTDEIGCENF